MSNKLINIRYFLVIDLTISNMKRKFSILLLLICLILAAKAQTRIWMEKRGGVYYLPCKVNGLPLQMILDTGASDVSIALPEAIVMIRNGTLTKSDILGKANYRTADGDISQGTLIILRRVEIGNIILLDVKASVVHSLEAPLLLGQSVLKRLGNIQVDFENDCLVIANNSSIQPPNNPRIGTQQSLNIPAQTLSGVYKYSTTLKDDAINEYLWSSPDENGVKTLVLPKYTEIYIIDDSSPYYRKVNVNGKIGYVNPYCLKKLK